VKKILYVVIAIMLLGFIQGCGVGSEPDSDKIQARATKALTSEAQRQIGMPNIVNFQERKLAKMIFELRDKEDMICYAYIKSDYQGKLFFIGKCIGYGLPYSVQYTNPARETRGYNTSLAMPQADPNGLFMPSGLSATWLMMIDPKTGTARPVYMEPEIVVSPFPLH